MSIATLAAYLELFQRPHSLITTTNVFTPMDFKTSAAGTAAKFVSMWAVAGRSAGATPTTSVSPARTLAGGLNQRARVTRQYVLGYNQRQNSYPGGIPIYTLDRLVHHGGLSGVVTTEQTTNLPTAALPRYTSGEGVHAFLEIYSPVGVTATTVTVRYTNSAGTPNRTSQAAVFGGTGNREASVLIPIMLAAGDTGIRSVEGVTVLATTGAAGNFGVTLARMKSINNFSSSYESTIVSDALLGSAGYAEAIDTGDPCLFNATFGLTPVVALAPVIVDTA
jgi:hypothetical protein